MTTPARAAIESGVTILPPRPTDDEVSALLDDLDKLQTLMAMQMSHGPVWRGAWDLVQRTRILIIERCTRSTAEPDEPTEAMIEAGEAEARSLGHVLFASDMTAILRAAMRAAAPSSGDVS